MKKLFILFIFTFIGLQAQAQGVFNFETESRDFGEITEGTKATHIFKFTNTGNAPIVLTNVRASCGCTTPEWPKEPVMPGATAEIKAIYNSKGRPGRFTKAITITSNATTPVKTLKISGTVTSDPSAQAQEFTLKQGLNISTAGSAEISLAKKEHNFGTVQVGNEVTTEFEYTNTGKVDLNLSRVFSACRCVTLSSDLETLKPGETGKFTLSYKPSNATDKPEKVFFSSNAPYDAQLFITLKAKVVDSIAPKSVLQESEGVGFGN